MQTKKILIGGEWRTGREIITVNNPYTDERIAEVFSADAAENGEAIAAAERAAVEMRNLPRYEIAKGLRAMAGGIEKLKQEFA